MIIVEGKEAVKEWFKAHPEMVSRVESITIQFKHPETFAVDEVLDRQLEVDDINHITDEGIFPEDAPGVYIWYYPMGVPHYLKLCDLDEVN